MHSLTTFLPLYLSSICHKEKEMLELLLHVLYFITMLKPSYVCLPFFVCSFVCSNTLFQKWVERFKEKNLSFLCDSIVFINNFWPKITSLFKWFIFLYSKMFKSVDFFWCRAITNARYEKCFIPGTEWQLTLVNENER